MMKNSLMLVFLLGTTSIFTSCLSEEQDLTSSEHNNVQKGSLVLNLNTSADFTLPARALNLQNYKTTSNYSVQILNTTNNNVVLECKGSELSSYLPKTLDIGSYRVTAAYGTESAASRNDFHVYGASTFTIKANSESTVDVNCVPTCGRVSVVFDAAMSDYYTDYSVSFTGTSALGANTFSWGKSDSEPWYVAVQENGEMVRYTISLTAKEDYLHQNTDGTTAASGMVAGTFKLERNKAHNLTVKPNYTPTTDGGMSLSITIDESTNDHEITYEVPITWI